MTTVIEPSTRDDENAMLVALGRLVELPPTVLSEESDDEMTQDEPTEAPRRTFRMAAHRCALHQFAGCQDASCAPPPVGTGGSNSGSSGRTTPSELHDTLSSSWRDIPADDNGPAVSSIERDVTFQVDGPRVPNEVRPRLKWSDPDRPPTEDQGDRYIELHVDVMTSGGDDYEDPMWEATVSTNGYGKGDASTVGANDRKSPPASLDEAKAQALDWVVANAAALADKTYRS